MLLQASELDFALVWMTPALSFEPTFNRDAQLVRVSQSHHKMQITKHVCYDSNITLPGDISDLQPLRLKHRKILGEQGRLGKPNLARNCMDSFAVLGPAVAAKAYPDYARYISSRGGCAR